MFYTIHAFIINEPFSNCGSWSKDCLDVYYNELQKDLETDTLESLMDDWRTEIFSINENDLVILADKQPINKSDHDKITDYFNLMTGEWMLSHNQNLNLELSNKIKLFRENVK